MTVHYRRSRTGRAVATTAAALAAAALLLPAGAATAADSGRPSLRAHQVAVFDESLDQSPEGVTVDRGAVYVSWKPLQQLVRLDRRGRPIVVATLPGVAQVPGGLIGIASIPGGDIVGALASTDARYNGLWRIRPDGRYRRLAALPTTAFPNDLTLTPDGRAVLVTDSYGGRIYRVELASGRVSVWLRSDLLAPPAVGPLQLGANGITFRSDREVVVANSQRGSLVRVPVDDLGRAGRPRVLLRVSLPDGVRADAAGTLYVAQPFQNLVLAITRTGTRSIVADKGDGLDLPVSIYLRERGRGARLLLVTSSSLDATDDRPNLTAIALGSCAGDAHGAGLRTWIRSVDRTAPGATPSQPDP